MTAQQLADMEARKDAAYLERNQVVSALAKCFPSGVARTEIEGWSDDWHGCVYIDLPTGQASWHFHDSHAYLFDSLPAYAGAWDGHSTEEKYARLAALSAPQQAARILFIATGETYEGHETYTRHEMRPALCDAETLYAAQQAARSNAPAVPDGVWEALQRLIENAGSLGPGSREDALLVAQHRARLLAARSEAPAGWKLVARVIAEDEHETVDVGLVDWVGHVALKSGTLLYAASPHPQRSEAPAGWKLVPIEPTPLMIDAARGLPVARYVGRACLVVDARRLPASRGTDPAGAPQNGR